MLLKVGVAEKDIVFINLVCCPEGIRALYKAHPGVSARMSGGMSGRVSGRMSGRVSGGMSGRMSGRMSGGMSGGVTVREGCV